MTQPLDYARPPTQTPPRLLKHLANGLIAYPLLPILSLYAQWLLSWYMLGHRQIPRAAGRAGLLPWLSSVDPFPVVAPMIA